MVVVKRKMEIFPIILYSITCSVCLLQCSVTDNIITKLLKLMWEGMVFGLDVPIHFQQEKKTFAYFL